MPNILAVKNESEVFQNIHKTSKIQFFNEIDYFLTVNWRQNKIYMKILKDISCLASFGQTNNERIS